MKGVMEVGSNLNFSEISILGGNEGDEKWLNKSSSIIHSKTIKRAAQKGKDLNQDPKNNAPLNEINILWKDEEEELVDFTQKKEKLCYTSNIQPCVDDSITKSKEFPKKVEDHHKKVPAVLLQNQSVIDKDINDNIINQSLTIQDTAGLTNGNKKLDLKEDFMEEWKILAGSSSHSQMAKEKMKGWNHQCTYLNYPRGNWSHIWKAQDAHGGL